MTGAADGQTQYSTCLLPDGMGPHGEMPRAIRPPSILRHLPARRCSWGAHHAFFALTARDWSIFDRVKSFTSNEARCKHVLSCGLPTCGMMRTNCELRSAISRRYSHRGRTPSALATSIHEAAVCIPLQAGLDTNCLRLRGSVVIPETDDAMASAEWPTGNAAPEPILRPEALHAECVATCIARPWTNRPCSFSEYGSKLP